jgi:hypothetical protein
MAQPLDTHRQRASTPSELRDYYKQLLENVSITEITTQLLQAVERGSIAPLTFVPWLGVSKSPATIRLALTQNLSALIRILGIERLRLALCSKRWRETWHGVGGVAGLLDIFSALSVREVKEVCRAIRWCRKGTDLGEKRECFTKLFKGLYPDYFPMRRARRRIHSWYYRLSIPACLEK